MAYNKSGDSTNRVDAQRQFALGVINDAFNLGFHCWWWLGLIAAFGLFSVLLSFVSAAIDRRWYCPSTMTPVSTTTTTTAAPLGPAIGPSFSHAPSLHLSDGEHNGRTSTTSHD